MTGSRGLPRELELRLQAVRSVGAITGAGVSSESGIRTYRGRGGIYDDPEEGERTVEALSGGTLRSDPDRTWRALGRLARQAVDARPSRAHAALAAIERKVERFVLLTQNVDGLHREAGSRNLIDIHGDIRDASCMACGHPRRFRGEELVGLTRAPRCASCGGVLRPDAVLFGELLPVDKVERIRDEFHRNVPELVLIAGTSALFPYITEPVLLARRRGRLTVEVNPEPTLLSGVVDFSLRGTAGALLPLIERALPSGTGDVRRPRDPYGRPLPAGSPDGMPDRELPQRVADSPAAALERAIALFDEQRFFEAHEFFEYLWKSSETAAEDRKLWRGVTQVAVGCCHVQRGNRRGAAAVLERAARNLEGYPPCHRGMDIRALIARALELADALRRTGGEPPGLPSFPRAG